MKKSKNNKIFFMKLFWFFLSFLINIIAIIFLFMKIFYPYHAWFAFLIYLIGWIPFILAFFKGKTFFKEYALKYKLEILISFISLIILFIILSIFPVNNVEILFSDKVQLESKIDLELFYLPHYLDRFEESENLFILEIKDIQLDNLSLEKRKVVLEKWSSYLNYLYFLDKIQEDNKFFYQINYLKYKELNEKSFILAYSSFIAKYSSALRILEELKGLEFIDVLLNEQNLELEIPKNSYLFLSNVVADPANVIQSNVGHAYLLTINQDSLYSLKQKSLKNHKDILKYAISVKYVSFRVNSALTFIEKNAFKSWFPIQKNIVELMRNTKIPLRYQTLSNTEDIEHIKTILEPGDVLIQRRNWYLSNVGLPGFWKHVALYVSNLSELDSYFGTFKGVSISKYIEQNYPEVYLEFQDGNLRTIEAESEGVISFTIEKSLELDYLGILRPKISKEEKLLALFRAFSHYGKPYDFNFDFVTENELVCSEVYYKSYLNTQHKLRIVNGRLVLSANDIVEDFDLNYGTSNQKLDFVYFLDALEKEKRTFSGNLNSFRNSWKRSSKDIWFIEEE